MPKKSETTLTLLAARTDPPWKLSIKLVNDITFALVNRAQRYIQIAASDFLPEIRHCNGSRRVLLPIVGLGVAVIYVANILIARWN